MSKDIPKGGPVQWAWISVRGTKVHPIEGERLLFGFLTCASNDVVRPIHAKAMPVVLTTEADFEIWLNAPTKEAMTLQRPQPNRAPVAF